ncbi:FxDxF family PEP-CTERM protein [uncultured Sphingomonas sp.]|uniref:FxDxF family PEP-CTERM protein n=1 Tax=uncultured Sphingomonas sp. TaxID=158754 RepID=UPI0025F07FCC|nr:FxDxF family PEP-CTERM protein [uncultured Sphingomonas sp.]
MRKAIYGVAAVLAAVTVAGSANAAAVINLVDGTGSFAGQVNGAFSDEWTFTTPDDGILSASLTSANTSGRRGITFTSVTLNGTDLTKVFAQGGNNYFAITDLLSETGTQTLRFVGNGIGGYGGSVSFNLLGDDGNPQTPDVPEPISWAMMVGGFGFVGTALRSQKRQRTSVTFA